MSSTSRPHLTPDEHFGRKLGKYEILCRLSTGGMSEIFLAFQRGVAGFTKFVVLKQILPDIRGDDAFVQMFLREAKISAALAHPNIAQVFDLGTDDDELFLAMEFVQGATLVEVARACRANGEAIPIGFTLAAVRDTARALHYAHTFTDPVGRIEQVIHRDVAEKNIMVSFEGVTKLLDFGIAKNLASEHRTRRGILKGTMGYIAPEQIAGQPLDARSDIFSLGVVLYQCLTEVMLFHGTTPEQQLEATMKGPVPPPSRRNPRVTPELDSLVFKALERDRDRRFPTALEFAREIERIGGDKLWRPDQISAFIKRLFSEQLAEIHQLLGTAPQLSGENSTSEFLLEQLHGGGGSERAASTDSDELTQSTGQDGAVRAGSALSKRATLDLRDHMGSQPRGPALVPTPLAPDPGSTVDESEDTFSGDSSTGSELTRTDNETDDDPLPDAASSVARRHSAHVRWTVLGAALFALSAVFAFVLGQDSEPAPAAITQRRVGDRSGVGATSPVKAVPPAPAATVVVTSPGDGRPTEKDRPAVSNAAAPPAESNARAEPAAVRGETPGNVREKAGGADSAVAAEPTPRRELSAAASSGPSREASREAAKPPAASPPSPPASTRVSEASPGRRSASKAATYKRGGSRTGVARSPARQEPPVTTARAASAAEAAAARTDPGQLSLVTEPRAMVLFKSQSLGMTPLQKVTLPPGSHQLRLRGPDDEVRTMQVKVEAGTLTQLRVKLDSLALE